MKTYLRENKISLLILSIPVLCLVILWNVNFFKLSYEHGAWKKLGMPYNTPVRRLGGIEFPYYNAWEIIKSGTLESENYTAGQPLLSVWVADGKMYTFWRDNWWTTGFLPFPTQEDMNNGKNCAASLQSKWKLPIEIPQGADVIEARGLCDTRNPQYAVFQIKTNGEIWEKYVDGGRIVLFRKWITALLLFFLAASHVGWAGLFKINPIQSRPDYEAK